MSSCFPPPSFKGTDSTLFFTMQLECFTFEITLHGIYLEEVHPHQNQLLQAVLRDIKTPHHHLIGCGALGLVSKCITGPLWRLLEFIHWMSTLRKTYRRLHCLLLKWSKDPSKLLVGKGLNEEIDENDCVFAELLWTSEDDQAVHEI